MSIQAQICEATQRCAWSSKLALVLHGNCGRMPLVECRLVPSLQRDIIKTGMMQCVLTDVINFCCDNKRFQEIKQVYFGPRDATHIALICGVCTYHRLRQIRTVNRKGSAVASFISERHQNSLGLTSPFYIIVLLLTEYQKDADWSLAITTTTIIVFHKRF